MRREKPKFLRKEKYPIPNHNPRVGGSNPSIATSKKPFDIGIYRVKGLFSCAAQTSQNCPRWTGLAPFGLQLCTVCAQFSNRGFGLSIPPREALAASQLGSCSRYHSPSRTSFQAHLNLGFLRIVQAKDLCMSLTCSCRISAFFHAHKLTDAAVTTIPSALVNGYS